MGSRLFGIIGYPLALILIITIVAAIMLGIGTALTFVFSVSVWEATVVVMVATLATYWLQSLDRPRDDLMPLDEYPDEDLEGEMQPRITVTDFVVQPPRRGRRRKR